MRTRAAGFALALLVEALVGLALLTFAPELPKPKEERSVPVFSLAPAETREERREESEPQQKRAQSAAAQAAAPSDAPAPAPAVAPPSPIVIPMTSKEMAALDIAKLPAGPVAPAPRRMMGPPDLGPPGPPDTQRVDGQGPNGEPLYAASWYREPYDDELKGYLSAASGPGWGLIACRTVPNWRVEDCVALGEYPTGSNIARSVLAAAWQFRVRPPRVGGQLRIGEWVRIRIDYSIRRQ